jgi:23S rRNA pseudouridine1911/1915/1917 synthase
MAQWHTFEYDGPRGERCDIAATLELNRLPEFSGVSRSRVQALIEQGGVLIDGREAPRSQKNVHPGMQLAIDLDGLRTLLAPPPADGLEPVDLPLTFLHTDDQLAVVIKPAGLTVHPAPTEDGPTLAAALLHHFGQLSDAGGAGRPGIVHRLDKETSGVLVVARNNHAHASLSRQFAERVVEKEYAALTIDPPEPPAGVIELPIGRHPRHRQRMAAVERGRPALSEYRVARMAGPFALTEVAIHTGRTHQIRVHLLSVGAGIIGDEKYSGGRLGSLRKYLREGKGNVRREWREHLADAAVRARVAEIIAGYPGIFLHARRLSFLHPASGERLEFHAPLPEAWLELLAVFSDVP